MAGRRYCFLHAIRHEFTGADRRRLWWRGDSAGPTANAPTESTPSDSTLSAGPLDDSTAPSTSPLEALEPVVDSGLITSEGVEIPLPPSVPDGAESAALTADLDSLFTILEEGREDSQEIAAVASHPDARTAWMFADILRFTRLGEQSGAAIAAFETVTGVAPPTSLVAVSGRERSTT